MMSFLIGLLFVTGTIALVWSGYLLMRWFAAKHVVDDSKELAGSVIFRVSALHGLILALVFAQQMSEYRDLQAEVVREATAVADIYFDAVRHGGDGAAIIQPALSRYVDQILSVEWASLADGNGLSDAAWQEWEIVYQAALDMETDTQRRVDLRRNMLEDVRRIAEARDQRANHGLKAVGTLFWLAAISGVFLISLAFYCFMPTLHNMMLIAIYAAFTGLVMFFIYSFSNPFSPPGALQPVAFEMLQADETFK